MKENIKLKEIKTIKEVELLVHSFYKKVRQDEMIGYFFNDVMNVDWDEHLPKMVSFWGMMLLGEKNFHGNPFAKHIEINSKEKLKKEHFDRWVELWHKTLDENFHGQKVLEAKFRANMVRKTMISKIVNKTEI